jgi:hypothetical protein
MWHDFVSDTSERHYNFGYKVNAYRDTVKGISYQLTSYLTNKTMHLINEIITNVPQGSS